MDERIFDFKFTKFNIKRFQNIKWYVHSSKFYEIHQENHSTLFTYNRYSHIFFVSELHLSVGKYRALDKYNYRQTQYLYKLFIVSKLYV